MIRFFQKILAPATSSFEQIQSRYQGVDRYFQIAFAIILGFFPPWVTFFSDKSLQVPVIVLALLVLMRIAIRPAYHEVFLNALTRPAGILLILLLAYAGWQGAVVSFNLGTEKETIRLAGKVLVLVLMALLTIYVWITPDEPYRGILKTAFMIGMFLYVLMFSLEVMLGNLIMVIYAKSWQTVYNFYDIRWRPGFDYFILPFLQLNRSLEVFSALIFPAMLLVRRRRVSLLLLLVTWVVLVALTDIGWAGGGRFPRHLWHADSESVLVGVILSTLIFILSCRYPFATTTILFASLVGGFLLSPLIFQMGYQLFESGGVEVRQTLQSRLEIWNAVSLSIPDNLLFGAGLDSMRYFGLANVGKINSHPHNMFLQVWLDFGIIGVSIVTGLMVTGWRAVSRMSANARPAINASITMLGILALTTHSLWQTWFLSLVVMVILLVSILYEKPGAGSGVSSGQC